MRTKFTLIFLSTFLWCFGNIEAQSTRDDIPKEQIPKSVLTVLESYIQIIKTSPTLEEAGSQFTKIAGGGLVNESVTNITLRTSILPFSLKKDYGNIKFYADPIEITRVNLSPNVSKQGFGESAIQGRVYKIWIGKKTGVAGMPAPISILLPEGHASIVDPKVVNIGSL